MILALLAAAASAASGTFTLPADVDPRPWAPLVEAAGLRLAPADGHAGAELVHTGGAWTLRVRDAGGAVHVAPVGAPVDDPSREDVVVLAVSLLEPMGTGSLADWSTAPVPLPPAPEPAPAPAPGEVPTKPRHADAPQPPEPPADAPAPTPPPAEAPAPPSEVVSVAAVETTEPIAPAPADEAPPAPAPAPAPLPDATTPSTAWPPTSAPSSPSAGYGVSLRLAGSAAVNELAVQPSLDVSALADHGPLRGGLGFVAYAPIDLPLAGDQAMRSLGAYADVGGCALAAGRWLGLCADARLGADERRYLDLAGDPVDVARVPWTSLTGSASWRLGGLELGAEATAAQDLRHVEIDANADRWDLPGLRLGGGLFVAARLR